MGRGGKSQRCPYDHKTIFKSRTVAVRTANKLPDSGNRIYWCRQAGGYHLTRYAVDEYNRRRSKVYDDDGGEDGRMQQLAEVEEAVAPRRIGRGGDCPTCGWLRGFHDPILHSYHNVPEHKTWKPGQPAPWEEEN